MLERLRQRWSSLRRPDFIRAATILSAVCLALLLRILVVQSWHAPAGDGLQYYALSQELIKDHRFAFGPTKPLQFSRLPGYPLFLAAVVHEAPLALHTYLWIAAQANAWLDLGTALLVFFMLRDRRPCLGAAWAGFVAVIVCPMLMFLSCYGLSESLATFLTTLTLYCALKDDWRWIAGAGAAFGLLQLTRIDGFAILPAVGLGLVFGARGWRALARRGAIFAAVAVVVFAPWPIRNYKEFGALHVEGTAWMRQDGRPLPLGMMRWMRTWGTGEWGQDFALLKVANNGYLRTAREGILLPAMWDTDAEKALVTQLFERYNHGGLSPALDADFDRLAAERRARRPLHYWIGLPARRFVAEWTPMPEWELPVRSRLLHLPFWRVYYNVFQFALFALALVGGILLWRRDWRFVVIVVFVVGARAGLHALAHPFPVERYMVESFPAMMALAGAGAVLSFVSLRTRLQRRLQHRRPPAAERA
ncbi:MAG TPA: hypothetical protein VGL86_18115 [Polyangia bacterium]|jgi:4-amino-4-deoxy-L-arabinose transferase-like glycosyltransferase